MAGCRPGAPRHGVLCAESSTFLISTPARCVRVFISANVEDTEAERRALHQHVIPKLREFCRDNYGLDFQAVDVYWGVELADRDDACVQALRMSLLDECIRTSTGPCFVGLLGERYGEPVLPGQIEAAEFERLLEGALSAGLDTHLLDTWYRRDENAVPPAYYLLPRSHLLKNFDNCSDSQAMAADHEQWMGISADIKTLLRSSASVCQSKGHLSINQTQKYFMSGLEEEFTFALGERATPGMAKRCVCYIRTIQDAERFAAIPQMARYLDLPGGIKTGRDPQAVQRLHRLRDSFIPACVSESKLRVYSSKTVCDARLGYTESCEQQYVEGLCRQFYEDMIDLIEMTVPKAYEADADPAYEEIVHHVSLCRSLHALYVYPADALRSIKDYVVGGTRRTKSSPLVVYGGPCSGKTVLMAEVTAQAYKWYQDAAGSDSEPVVVIRFVGQTEESSYIRNLLKSLCEQLAWVYAKLVGPLPESVRELWDIWVGLLHASTSQRPLLIVLDGIDQLMETDGARTVWWVPQTLPPSVRLVVSTPPNKFGILHALKKIVPDDSSYVEMVPRSKKNCNQLLKSRLGQIKRKVTSGQQIYINEALVKCPLPLYLNLLFMEISKWRSHKDVDERTLCRTVHEAIENLFARIEEKCGVQFVARALGYLTLAKDGLSETELEDVLSLDDHAIRDYAPEKTNSFARFPHHKIATLRQELRGYLLEKEVHSTGLLVWANRQLLHMATKLYLGEPEVVQYMHNVLADYFMGQWAGGRPKPYCPSEAWSQSGNTSRHHKEDKNNHGGPKFERGVISQPWDFHCRLLEISQVFVNLRKLKELPYHLTKCGRSEELVYNVILDFSYMHAMVLSGRLHALIAEMDSAHSLTLDKDVRFLADTLRSVSPAILEDPYSLSTELQQRMLPFVRVYPKIRHIMQVCDREGLRYCSIVTLLSPMDQLNEPKRVLLTTNAVRIMDVLPTTKPNAVISVLDNGTASTWDLGLGQPFKHTVAHGAQVLGVQLNRDEKYLVASTLSNTLLVFDYCSSTLLYEVEVKGSKLTAQDHQSSIGGFTLSTNHALAWLERSNEVHVIDLNYGWPLCMCHCWYEVTCAQFSDDGTYAFCGQQLNTTSIFLLESGERLATVTSENSTGYVHAILVSAQTHELYTVDCGGSLTVWDLEEISNPQLLEEFDCRADEAGDVVSVELAKDLHTLLICKNLSMEVWDTFSWSMTDKFKARRNERFLCAVLSRNCESIIAAIELMPSIFIWRRDTGQCLATLPGNSGTICKLIKTTVNDFLLTVTSKGVLSIWDLEAIDAISAVDKTGKAIRSILLPSRGESVFTIDGTENVYKWNIHSGFIESLLRHDYTVEQFVLTSSAEILISADSGGNQYVWHTVTGECLFRISGPRVSQLLVTHNDLFVVSLCEKKASRVWRLGTGNKVCNIPCNLTQARITAANTFLVGVQQSALLAVNLWTGSVSKKFTCEDGTHILAYKLLPDCPDYVALVTSAGVLYTWSLADEAVRRRVQLPLNLHKRLEDFQISPSGKLAILATGDDTLNVLDLQSGKLRVVLAGGAVWQQRLSMDGRYIVYACFRKRRDAPFEDGLNTCLRVVRLADGKCIGTCTLYKVPSFLVISKRHLNIVIGFEDGSVGAYTVVDHVDAAMKIKIAASPSRRIGAMSGQQVRPKRAAYTCKPSIDLLWRDATEEIPGKVGHQAPCANDLSSVGISPKAVPNYCYPYPVDPGEGPGSTR
uniref:NACHT and WD repeat domain containing 2 n=1 Tax=Eptatretus burgeri TaxID=7764 RepID=A0A8C4WZ30_EPTBU